MSIKKQEQISGSGEDKIASVSINSSGLYVLGTFQNIVDFDLEPDFSNTLNGNTGACFYARYSFKLPQTIDVSSFSTHVLPDGKMKLSALTDVGLNAVNFTSGNPNVAQIIGKDILQIMSNYQNDETLIRAYHLGNTSFLPTDTVVVMRVNSYSLVNNLEKDLDQQLCITPNPVNDFFELQIKNPAIIVESVDFFDTFGRKITSLPYRNLYQVSQLSRGIYYLQIQTNRGIVRQKLLKQ